MIIQKNIYLTTLASGVEITIPVIQFLTDKPDAFSVYIQSSVHAAETQGYAVALLLIEHFAAYPPPFNVTIVPLANPYAASCKMGEYTYGRFDPVSGDNWNRSYIDMTSLAEECINSNRGKNFKEISSIFKKKLSNFLGNIVAEINNDPNRSINANKNGTISASTNVSANGDANASTTANVSSNTNINTSINLNADANASTDTNTSTNINISADTNISVDSNTVINTNISAISYPKRLAFLLQNMAVHADIVLDLHCDTSSALHLYYPSYSAKSAINLDFPFMIEIPHHFAGALDEASFCPWVKLMELYNENNGNIHTVSEDANVVHRTVSDSHIASHSHAANTTSTSIPTIIYGGNEDAHSGVSIDVTTGVSTHVSTSANTGSHADTGTRTDTEAHTNKVYDPGVEAFTIELGNQEAINMKEAVKQRNKILRYISERYKKMDQGTDYQSLWTDYQKITGDHNIDYQKIIEDCNVDCQGMMGDRNIDCQGSDPGYQNMMESRNIDYQNMVGNPNLDRLNINYPNIYPNPTEDQRIDSIKSSAKSGAITSGAHDHCCRDYCSNHSYDFHSYSDSNSYGDSYSNSYSDGINEFTGKQYSCKLSDFKTIYSPVGGIIISNAEIGRIVRCGESLMTIINQKKLNEKSGEIDAEYLRNLIKNIRNKVALEVDSIPLTRTVSTNVHEGMAIMKVLTNYRVMS